MAYPIYMQTDTADFDGPLDLRRSATPTFWSGTDIEFKIAIFEFGTLADVGNFTSLTIEIKAMGSNGSRPLPGVAALMSKTVTSINKDLTAANWATFADCHASVKFTASESAIAAGTHWLVISAVVEKSGVEQLLTLAAGEIIVEQDGHGVVGEVVVSDGTAYTKDASDARYARLVAGASVFVSATGGSDATGVRGRSDLPFATLSAGVEAASAGDTVFVSPGSYAAANVTKFLSFVFQRGVTLAAPLAVESDGVRLSGSLSADSSLSYSITSSAARTVRIDGVLAIDTPLGANITATGGLLLDLKNGSFSAPGLSTSDIAATAAWSALSGKPDSFTPTAHAASHATGAADALAPSDIGAASVSELSDEATARAAADATLASSLTEETTRAKAAEALKAPLESPALSGTPTAPTATSGTSTTQIATTAFVAATVSGEATARASADTSLSSSLSTETNRATAAEALKLAKASNLADLADAAAARGNLELSYIPLVNILPDSGRFAAPTTVRSLVTPSVKYVASTLSVTASAATVSDSAGGIDTSSFSVGTIVTMSGWSNSANNLVQLRVSSVSASTLVLEGDGATSLVDESAGSSVTLTAHPLTNSAGLISTYNATAKFAGKFIHGNTTNGGSTGALSPVTAAAITSMGRTGTYARYGVEFGLVEFTATGSDSATYYSMILNDGSAWFGSLGNYLTIGFWAVCTSGSARLSVYTKMSVDGGNYSSSSPYPMSNGSWHHYKGYTASSMGYQNAVMAISGIPGTKVVIALPAAFPGLVPSAYTWSAPLINYYRS